MQAEEQLAKARAERNAEIERQNAIRAQAKLNEKPLEQPIHLADVPAAPIQQDTVPAAWTVEVVNDFKLQIKATDAQFTALITYLVNADIDYEVL